MIVPEVGQEYGCFTDGQWAYKFIYLGLQQKPFTYFIRVKWTHPTHPKGYGEVVSKSIFNHETIFHVKTKLIDEQMKSLIESSSETRFS